METRVILLSAAIYAGMALPLAAQEQQRITVGGFRHSGDRAKLIAARITGTLETELLGQPEIRVVERKEKDQVLEEQKLQQTGATDVETAVELGRNLNADKIVFGSVEVADGSVLMTVKAVRVENSELIFSESAEARAEDNAALNKARYDLIEHLLASLTGRAVTLSRPQGPESLILTLAEGYLSESVKLPRRSAVMAVALADGQPMDSAMVTKRNGWGAWNVKLRVPNYEGQGIAINFYVKGKEGRQFIGECRFEALSDGVFSFGTGEKAGAASGRFKLLLELE